MLLAGGYWYLRNLVHDRQSASRTRRGGRSGLPTPERMFELRPGFSVAHYWNDSGRLVGLVLPKLSPRSSDRSGRSSSSATVAGGAYALWKGREPILRALGAVALLTAFAYVFTPLTAGRRGGRADRVRVEHPLPRAGRRDRPGDPAAAFPLCARPSAAARSRCSASAALALADHPHHRPVARGRPHEGRDRDGPARARRVRRCRLGLSRAAGSVPRRRRARHSRSRALVALGALVAGFVVQRHYLERRYDAPERAAQHRRGRAQGAGPARRADRDLRSARRLQPVRVLRLPTSRTMSSGSGSRARTAPTCGSPIARPGARRSTRASTTTW